MTAKNGRASGKNQEKSGTTDGYVPFRIDTSQPPVETDRIPLFYIDDKEYTGPARVSVGTALKALEIAATQGITAGAWHCLIESIGRDAYEDLTACEHVTYEQAQALFSKISDMYFGQAMELAGK